MKFSNSFEVVLFLFLLTQQGTNMSSSIRTNDQTESSIENDVIDTLPNGKSVPMPLLLLRDTISFTSDRESWHGYIQIRNCDLSKHAGILTYNNGHTKARWPNGDIQHSRATSLLADPLSPPAVRQDKVACFAYKRTIWTNLG